MKKAVFLDRDGVINSDVGHYYIYRSADFLLNIGVAEGLKRLFDAGYLLIIISNQGGIAKKIYSKNEVEHIHAELYKNMLKNGVKISEMYYCPHHSAVEKCICRKPDSQMLEKAIARFGISIKKSYFIGDSVRDIDAAKKIGLSHYKIEANENIEKYVDLILKGLRPV